MPTVIGHHDVKDTQHWLASPKREEFFGPLGVTNIRTFTDPQIPRGWRCSWTSPTSTPRSPPCRLPRHRK